MLDLHHTIVSNSDIYKLRLFKSRVVKHDVYAIGDGSVEQGFIHLDIRTVTGKAGDDTQREKLSRAALEVLSRTFRQCLDDFPCDISVQITEASPVGYTRIRSSSIE
jgi:5-carboxymethyl-2-hydroxymuconate isomerase